METTYDDVPCTRCGCVCDDLRITVNAGRIVEESGIEGFLQEPLHPYTKGLFGAIPLPGADAKKLFKEAIKAAAKTARLFRTIVTSPSKNAEPVARVVW